MKSESQTLRIVMSLALVACSLFCLTVLNAGVYGLLACCLVLVDVFLAGPATATQLFGWRWQAAPSVQEPYFELFVARPPPYLLA